jgi:O-antigen/teichoic acid export membrane protein
MDIHNSSANRSRLVSSESEPARFPGKVEVTEDGFPVIDPNEQHFSTDHLLTNLKDRTISSGLVTTLAQGAQFALTLGSTMVLARLLTPRDFGLVAMVMTVMGFLRVFKDAGLSTATVQRDGITHAQVSNLFWINAALSGAITLIVMACAPVIAWFYREPRLVGITLVLSITFLLTGLTVQHLALLNRQMRFEKIALIQVGSLLAGIVVGIAMAWLQHGYWSLVGTELTTAMCGLLLTWVASRWRPQLPSRRSGTWPLLSFGANLSVSSFIYSLARGSDGLFIGRLYGPESVGLYSRASALLHRPIQHFLTPIDAVFVPVLSRLQLQPERYRRTFLQTFEPIALVSFFFTGLFFALAEPLTLVVLGPKWEKAAVIFAGFTFAALFFALSSATSLLLASQGRGRDWLVTSMWVSSVTVCSFLAGLPFGPAGVAISYSLSGVFLLLPIIFHVAGRRGPVSNADLWTGCLRHLPVWGVVCGAAWLARVSVANSSPLAQLCICVPVALVIGGVFIYIYVPSRRAFLSFFDALRQWQRSRAVAG